LAKRNQILAVFRAAVLVLSATLLVHEHAHEGTTRTRFPPHSSPYLRIGVPSLWLIRLERSTSPEVIKTTMRIETEDMGSYHLVRCSGILNNIMRDESSDVIHPLIENHKRVLVDLSGVDRITTEGISAFVTLVARANAKGSRVVFVNPTPFVKAIFEATQITKFLETVDSLEAGVERLNA